MLLLISFDNRSYILLQTAFVPAQFDVKHNPKSTPSYGIARFDKIWFST